MTTKKTQAKAESGDPIVRIRTQMARQRFPYTGIDGRTTTYSSKGHILELDTRDPDQKCLLERIRSLRSYGSEYREFVEGSTEKTLQDGASALHRLSSMDAGAIWSLFEPHELEHFQLDHTSKKEELVIAFLHLNKSF